MNNKEEKINALLLDNRFVDWVINPQSPYAEYWLQWISANAENAALTEEAQSFLLELKRTENETAKEINDEIANQMLMNIRKAIDQDSPGVTLQNPTRNRWYWAAAAVFCTLAFLGVMFFIRDNGQLSLAKPAKQKQPSSELTRFNGSDKNELVFLPDGSKVTLAKGSRISYSRLMNGKKRRVCLSGEAFFDVTKNPEKPFYI